MGSIPTATSTRHADRTLDNLTHSLTGLALYRAGLGRTLPGAPWLMVLAANLPDADLIFAPGGSLYYLHHHRGASHSLVGVAVLSVMLAFGIALVQRRRGRPPRVLASLIAIVGAMATHPLLDLCNSYGLRPFLPWSSTWYYGDALFIIDPWVWLLLAAGIALTSETRREVRLLLATVAVPGLGFLWVASDRGLVAPESLILCLVAFALTAGWLLWRPPAGNPRHATTALLAVALYAGTLACVSRGVRDAAPKILVSRFMPDRAVGAPPGPVRSLAATPRALSWSTWTILSANEQAVGSATYDLRSQPPSLPLKIHQKSAAHPAVQAAARTCSGRVASEFHRFSFATVTTLGQAGYEVVFDDLRFLGEGGRSFAAVRVRLDPEYREIDPPPCPGWH